MTNKNFVVAKVYIFIASIVLTAMFFVPCNMTQNGVLFNLLNFIINPPFSNTWTMSALPNIYFAVAAFSILVILTGFVLLFVKSAKIFRLMAFATYTIAAMLYAFAIGSELNAILNAQVLYSYAMFALVFTAIAAMLSVRVTIYKKSDIEKANEDRESV